MYPYQPTPPMYYDKTCGFYQPMQAHPKPPAPPMHYHYTPRFYQPQSYEPSPPPPQATPISQGPSLEDLVKSMAISSLQFQQSTQSSLQNLEIQMSLMANELSEIKAQRSGEELEVAPQEPEEPFIPSLS